MDPTRSETPSRINIKTSKSGQSPEGRGGEGRAEPRFAENSEREKDTKHTV